LDGVLLGQSVDGEVELEETARKGSANYFLRGLQDMSPSSSGPNSLRNGKDAEIDGEDGLLVGFGDFDTSESECTENHGKNATIDKGFDDCREDKESR
jgi:hypothetical protein